MPALALTAVTFFSTLFGGLFAIRFRHRLHTIMAFTAGVLLGVVSFDLLPEIVSQVNQSQYPAIEPMIALVVGFLLFHIVEKSILIHHEREEEYAAHRHPQVGIASALALAGHSFMDGVGIGLGFRVNFTTGILVALAVIAHDFTDGMNTVTLMLVNKNSPAKAKAFLLLDAITPLLGALSTLFFAVSTQVLIWYLGFFAGFLLYIGASDILPEAHSTHSSWKLIGLTVFGVLVIFVITRFV